MDNPYKAPTSTAKPTNTEKPVSNEPVSPFAWGIAIVIVLIGISVPIVLRDHWRSPSLFNAYLPLFGVTTYLLAMVILAHGYQRLLHFVDTHPAIATTQDLEDFKALARHDMKLAYSFLAPFLVAFTCGIASLATYGHRVFIVMTILLAGQHLLGQRVRHYTTIARALPAATEELDREHKDIGGRWKKKLWPDF